MDGKDRKPPGEAEPPREGPASDEVLDVGQEEVFSRAEVELGRIEHSHNGGGDKPHKTPDKTHGDDKTPGDQASSSTSQ